MHVDLFRSSSRLARAAGGGFLTLLAWGPGTGGFCQARTAPPKSPAAAAAQREQSSAAINPQAQNQADKLYQSGIAALKAKDYAAAEKAFLQCRKLEPTNLRALLGVVETYMAQNMSEQAIRLLEAESAADPANRDIATTLANVFARAGKWDQAISGYQKLLNATDKGTTTAGELYLSLGETCRRRGDMPSAIAALRNARQILPDDARVLSALALTLESVSSWEAQQAYEDALRVSPNNAILLNNLAFSLAEHGGDLDRALSLARRAQQLLPSMLEIADTVGAIYMKKDMAGEARAVLAPLVQQQPGNPDFRAHLAAALERDGNASPALRDLAKALREEPTDANRRLVVELLKISGLPVSR